MEDLLAPVLFMLVVGGMTGYLVGKLIKRASGMALTIGILAFALIVLVYAGDLDVNIDAIYANMSNILGILAPLGIIALVSSVPFIASFVAGLFIGYRRY